MVIMCPHMVINHRHMLGPQVATETRKLPSVVYLESSDDDVAPGSPIELD